MDHAEKISRWREFVRSKGLKDNYPAPHERLLIKFTGKECAPTMFWPAWIIGTLAGLSWSAFWSVFMYLTGWYDRTLVGIAVPSVVGGFLFGLSAMALHVYLKHKNGLTTWERFSDDFPNPSDKI